MKKKTYKTSINDNWYSDIYPTFIDFLAVEISAFFHRQKIRKLGYWFYSFIKSLRRIEIYLLRRRQINYDKRVNKFFWHK